MSETRGYQTINDRTDGWGPGVVEGDQPTADPTPQPPRDSTANPADRANATRRWTRELKARKSFKEDGNTAIADRTSGYGGIDLSAGADGYGTDMETETPSALADPADYKNGIFTDEAGDAEAGTGSNTAYTHTDPENTVYGRAAHDGEIAILDDSTAAKIAAVKETSIVDRTDGWGHSDVPASVAKKQGNASSYTAATGQWADATVNQSTTIAANRDDA